MKNSHVLQKSIRKLYNILNNYGFKHVYSPVIDSKKNCFDNLLMTDHFCVSEKETFFLYKDSRFVLRPHSSNFQNIVFSEYKEYIFNHLEKNSQAKFFTIGKVFRKDKSSRHSYFFHQFDGLVIANSLDVLDQIENLLTIIFSYLENQKEYLIRESYFPFTEPSYEVDIKHKDNWLEILGCGITHKKILHNFKLDKITEKVFAFGVGVERLVMIKNNIDNIHQLRTN